MATRNQQQFISPVLGPDLQRRQLEMQRNQMMAQQLLQSEAPQGQMVSGHYVAPSITQHLAHGLRQYQGNKALNDLPRQAAELQQAQQDRIASMFGLGGGQQSPQGGAQTMPVSSSGASPQQYAAALTGNSGQSGMPLLPGRGAQESYQIASMVGLPEYMKLVAGQTAPTSLQSNLQSAGLQPGTPEYQRAVMENVNPGQRPTSLMQNVAAAGLQPGTPEYRDAILAGTKQGTTVNVNPGEKAWDTESAKLFAKRYDDITAGAMNAQQMLGMYDLAEQALASGVRTGVGAEAELSLRQLGAAMGMDTSPEKLAGGELIRAVQNRMALTMRSPDGGMGMPGALSDRDIKFLKDSQIGIDRSPEGNRKMLQAFRAMENRKVQIAQLADDYIAQNGRLDAGFNRAVREFSTANPLFAADAPDERMTQLDSILGF